MWQTCRTCRGSRAAPPILGGVGTRASAVAAVLAALFAAFVLVVWGVFECWDRSPCGTGTVLATVAELLVLAAVAALGVAVTGTTAWLRHRAVRVLGALLALLVVGGNAWGHWNESGREHRPVSGWVLGFEWDRLCYAAAGEPVRCVGTVVGGFSDLHPGDPFEGTLMRETRLDDWHLLLGDSGPDLRPLPPRPDVPVPDASVTRRQSLWLSWADERPGRLRPPLDVAYVLDPRALPRQPVGAAYRVAVPQEGRGGSITVTLTCPPEPGVTLWSGGAPVEGAHRAEQEDGWVRVTAQLAASPEPGPLFCASRR